MDPFTMVALVTFLGCGTGVIVTTVDKLTDRRARAREQELRLVQERTRQQEERIVELRRQNEQLQKQLEWHATLVEAQDRVVKQLGDGAWPARVSASSPSSVSAEAGFQR